LTAEQLQSVVAEAIGQWAATGLTAEQVALLEAVSVQVVDLSPQPYLGLTTPSGILIDDDGAGLGWKYERVSTKYEIQSTNASSFDLLTVVLHEFGHVLGLEDLDPQTHAQDLMAASLAPDEQRGFALASRVVESDRLASGPHDVGQVFLPGDVSLERLAYRAPAESDVADLGYRLASSSREPLVGPRVDNRVDDLFAKLGEEGDWLDSVLE
jgi:hypothetical protein